MQTIQTPKNKIEVKNFCDGDWYEQKGDAFDIVSPYTGQVIGSAKDSTQADIDLAIQKAHAAYQLWSKTPIKERCAVMFKFREILLRDIKMIANRISSECGKTLPEAEAELMKGIEVIEFATSLQNLDAGGKMEVSRGVWCEYRREPLGVVAGITPFNFPSMVPLWMIPIAITLGNAFVWKPSDKTPLTSMLIADAAKEAGLPKGVLTIIQGRKQTAEGIMAHPHVQAIGFVGSTRVAQEVYKYGSTKLKRVLALGGAKNHIVLLPDADLEMSSKGIADSFTGCAGQRCMAASVLLAVADEKAGSDSAEKIERLIQGITETAKSLTLGDRMGAIISKTSLENLKAAIDEAEKNGAKVILDGRKNSAPTAYDGGYWLGPTILDHVKPGSRAASEELFGPVLSIIRVKNLTQALEIQNSNPYGNAVSIFTQNGAAAERIAQEGKAGMIGINIGVPVPREPFSFGGTHESKYGVGDITGIHSLNFWSHPRKLTTKWATQKDSNWMS
jgi:malonate-semialdehyde dehydrogenase (acetylating) / methylmalonate-semialdehyde dehydrogenase